MEGLTIRPLAAADVPAVAALTRASPETAQWSEAEFARLAEPAPAGMSAWVAEDEQGARGYIAIRCAADEVEILNIVVQPAVRRRGVAGRLMQHALEAARAAGAQRAFLEVRESNHGAITLYERHGFQPSGRRPNYYSSPEEDALILSLALARAGTVTQH